jgi:hypothetical protein
MQKITLNDNDRISICLDIADMLLENDGEPIETITDKHGDKHYTDDTQDRFNGYFDMVEGVLHDHGLINWEGE